MTNYKDKLDNALKWLSEKQKKAFAEILSSLTLNSYEKVLVAMILRGETSVVMSSGLDDKNLKSACQSLSRKGFLSRQENGHYCVTSELKAKMTNYIDTENISQEVFYCKVNGFLNNPDNFPAGAYEEPYWVSRRYSDHYKATQEEMDTPLPNEHLAVFANPGNSEGWILSVYLAPKFKQLIAAKYFCKESCLEAVKQLTTSLYRYQ